MVTIHLPSRNRTRKLKCLRRRTCGVPDCCRLLQLLLPAPCAGVAYCQIFDIMHPGRVPMHKLICKPAFRYCRGHCIRGVARRRCSCAVDAKHEGDRRRNLEILETFFHKQAIPKVVPGAAYALRSFVASQRSLCAVANLAKGRFADNLDFLHFCHHYYASQSSAQGVAYDPFARRCDAQRSSRTKAHVAAAAASSELGISSNLVPNRFVGGMQPSLKWASLRTPAASTSTAASCSRAVAAPTSAQRRGSSASREATGRGAPQVHGTHQLEALFPLCKRAWPLPLRRSPLLPAFPAHFVVAHGAAGRAHRSLRCCATARPQRLCLGREHRS